MLIREQTNKNRILLGHARTESGVVAILVCSALSASCSDLFHCWSSKTTSAFNRKCSGVLLLPSCFTKSCISAMKLLQTQRQTSRLHSLFLEQKHQTARRLRSWTHLLHSQEEACMFFCQTLGFLKTNQQLWFSWLRSALRWTATPEITTRLHQALSCTHGTALVHLNTVPCLPLVWLWVLASPRCSLMEQETHSSLWK